MFAAGTIAAAILNTAPFGDPNRTAANPLDFVPGHEPKEEKVEQPESDGERLTQMLAFFGCGPGGPTVGAASGAVLKKPIVTH
jgi:hypothetical protein